MPKIKRGREFDDGHLSLIRQLPCISCWHHAPSEAAHVRTIGTGMARKPNDKHALPLCDQCHRVGKHAEHNTGSSSDFYDRLGLDPIKIAEELYRLGELTKMQSYMLQLRFF